MSFKYFENKSCEFYPCHNTEHINCLLCFCPLYTLDCPGTPKYIKDKKGKTIKDCSECVFPHIEENYDKILKYLK